MIANSTPNVKIVREEKFTESRQRPEIVYYLSLNGSDMIQGDETAIAALHALISLSLNLQTR